MKTDRALTTTFGYIAGTSNCGSTLMSFILRAQPGVASVGEVAFAIPKINPGRYQCSCGSSLETCQFWVEVGHEMARRGHLFNAEHWDTAFQVSDSRLLDRVALGSIGNKWVEGLRNSVVHKVPRWRKRLKKIGARNVALTDSIASVAGASVFIDASKEPRRLRLLTEYGGIEPRVIHLLRDAPAFVNSYIKHGREKFFEGIRWWNKTIWQLEHIRATMPADRWLLVRYEDFCADPPGEIRRILSFLGAPTGSPVLDFRRGSHHIIGNRRMRLGSTSEIRLDTSWREELSKTQVDEITTHTAKYRQLFGYATT